MSIGARIKEKRQEKNISREVLSNKLNVSVSTLAKYEQNQRMPKLETLKKLAEILDVSVEYLLEEQSFHNTLKKFEDMSETIQILNRQEKEQLLTNDLGDILKTFEKLKANQNDMMNSLYEQTKLLEEHNTELSFIALCKSFDIKINNPTTESDDYDEDKPSYQIQYKDKNFIIDYYNFQKLLNNICKLTIKEILTSQFYDFIDG